MFSPGKDKNEETPFLVAYHKIGQKLKKRLFKKSNAREALVQFADLTSGLRRQGNHVHAALCSLAMARCEQALGNPSAEAAVYVDAAHTFIIEETVSHALGVDECEEFVTEAIQCYLLAVEIHIAHGAPNIAAGLFQELAGALKRLGKLDEASEYFHKGADLTHRGSPMMAIQMLQEAVDCEIRLGDHDDACATLSSIIHLSDEMSPVVCPPSYAGPAEYAQSGSFAPHAKLSAQVTLCLLHLTRRTFHAAENAVMAIRKGGGGDGLIDDILFSLVHACRTGEVTAAEELELELATSRLDPRQQEILHRVVLDLGKP